MNLPLLFTYRRCPYAMRARMALLLSGQTVIAHEVVLRDKPPGLLSASPKGTVPVLVLPDGRVIDESLHIMQWAFAQNDDLGVGQVLHDAQALAWITRNDTEFKALLDQYKYPQRFGLNDRHLPRDAAVQGMLSDMDAQLSGHARMAGAAWSALDLALLPFVRQFAAVDAPWFASLRLPALQAWLHEGLSSPWFARTMCKWPANAQQVFGP